MAEANRSVPAVDAATSSAEGLPRVTFDRVRMHVDVTFWMALRQRKLQEWQLREPTVPITGSPTSVVAIASDDGDVSGRGRSTGEEGGDVVFSRESFAERSTEVAPALLTGDSPSPRFIRAIVPGTLRNFNVLGDLVDMDLDAALFAALRGALLEPLLLCAEAPAEEEEEATVWRQAPYLFAAMYVYVDAKNYAFHHREAFPVLSVDAPLFVKPDGVVPLPPGVAHAIRTHSGYRAVRYGAACVYSPFLCVVDAVATEGSRFEEFSPSRYARLVREASEAGGRVLVCFQDLGVPSASAGAAATLGWPMRNWLLCMRLRLPDTSALELYAIRARRERDRHMRCVCAPLENAADMLSALRTADDHAPPPAFLRLAGWRKTSVHVANTSSHMNPTNLAEEGSRLNLELMKWRQLPSLDLQGLASCRALLLGAGTLGCNVARNLLMWGVRHLTLVDRGTVHYSNLARQSLFTAQDAAGTGRHKVDAAADALRAILPSVTAVPVRMTIHMPGHRTDTAHETQTLAEIEQLAGLVKSHDVVFLLTDSWEARWLPTVLATAHNTPLINVALGFDSYVVMRHGLAKSDVRCYFCSDVAAPTDSVTARALDQQCTVTRPGVSGVASALAVELLAALYQQSPPFEVPVAEHSRLGLVPEQIRGSVFTHETTLLSGKRNPNCTACSVPIVEAYEREGCAFLLRCINDPTYIETISGLGAVKAVWEAQNAEADWSCQSSTASGSHNEEE